MEIDQVYKAPSIPKLNRRNIKSTLIGGAIKPGVELKKSKFSFIKPLVKLIPDSLVPIRAEENKESLVKNIQSGVGIQKLLEQSNKILSQIKDQLSLLIRDSVKPDDKLNKSKNSFIKPLVKLIPDSLVPIKDDENRGSLVKNIQSGAGIQKLLEQSNKILTQIKEQLSLDYLSRINQEKKELAENKKKIATEKVKDKEKKIESGGRGLLGKTLDAVIAPAKSIFQKLLDFFSIILTGILVNTAFKWLQKPENQKKLQDFFNFLKEYWQELLIVFGAVKLLGLIRKIQKTANAIKSLIDFFKSNKTKLPCNCPKSPAQKGGLPDCDPKFLDCIESLIKDPKKGPGFLQSLAQALLTTAAFAPFLLLIKKPTPTPQPKQKQAPTPTPTPLPISPKTPPFPPSPPSPPTKPPSQTPVPAPSAAANKRVPFTRKPAGTPAKTPTSGAFRSGLPMRTRGGLFSILAQYGLGKIEQKLAEDKILKLQQLKISDPQEYKKQINQIRIDAKNEKYLNLANEIIMSPSIPSADILKALGELKQNEIPKSFFDIGYNKNKLTPDLNKDGSPISNQSLNQPTNQKVLQTQVEKIVKEKRPNLNPQQVLQVTSKAIQIIKTGVEIGRAITIALGSAVITQNSKGGTIPGLAGGGTVGGPGRLGVDSVPAMIASGAKTMMGGANALLAPGEEVIKTSSAMLFRPLLKDINDNAGRLWQAFTNAVRKQNLNETIVTDLISQFGKIIEEFKDLLDKETIKYQRMSSRGNNTPPSGGTLNPRRIVPPAPAKSSLSSPSTLSEAKPQKMPSDNMNMMKINLPPPPTQKITPSQVSTIEPKITLQNPVDITQNIIQPQLKVPSAEKTLVDNTKIYVIPLKETVPSFKTSSKSPTINHITLPTKTVNLGGSPKPKSLPSSPSGTSVPSISPIDESNDYVFMTPAMYGILV